jgi:hypothetical protein
MKGGRNLLMVFFVTAECITEDRHPDKRQMSLRDV